MTTRTHLSIGEVLSLLSDDFPDLTITKIRFLESQGLIDPERTASGYRKFYDFDIERLRWILRQQRENFLPLKVIRDRLDESDGRTPTDDEESTGQAHLDLAGQEREADPPPVWMADHAAQTRTAQKRRSGKDPAPRPSSAGTVTDGRSEPGSPSPSETGGRARPTNPKTKTKTKQKPKAGSGALGTSTEKPKTADRPEQAVAEERSTGSTGPGQGPETTDLTDVSLTRAELLGAAGLDESQLDALESFGIVTATDGPDAELYGADALLCARHAATMLALGLEARHLRAFKVSADREAGLYEQLILPVLRRRTPGARAEATQTVDQLVAAGAAIHAALLRSSLADQLGPRSR